jgi:hypothetical protein
MLGSSPRANHGGLGWVNSAASLTTYLQTTQVSELVVKEDLIDL